jgi:hypothetical protein
MAVNNLNTPGVGIQPSIVDAKGDLIAGTAADAVSRLAAGTNGHVLVADSGETTGLKWNNPGTVGGLVHINTTTFTGVSSISLPTSTFSANYETYKIIFQYTPTGSTNNTFRLRSGSTDLTSGVYTYSKIQNSGTTVSGSSASSQTSFLIDASGGQLAHYFIEITNPFIAKTKYLTMSSQVSGTRNFVQGCFINDTNTYDSATFIASTGNLEGTVSVWGYKF